MQALVDYEAHLCACGLPESVADEDPDLELQYRVCPVCAGLAKAGRLQHEQDAEALRLLGDKPPPDADRPEDGRRIVGYKPVPPPDSSTA